MINSKTTEINTIESRLHLDDALITICPAAPLSNNMSSYCNTGLPENLDICILHDSRF
jgi:hypothetical protein